jgi:TRAP-type C4-dicarboxylate transport system permease small subunit
MDGPFDARRVLGPATNWIALIGALAILAMAGAVVVDVLMRWIFNAPILGVDDFAAFNLAVIVASFFPICLVGGHFVTIRFVGKALGERRALWLEVLGAVATTFIFALLAWQFVRFTWYDVTLTGLATHVLEIPQAPWWWIVTTIVVICVPIQLVVLVETIVRAVLGVPRPADGETKTDAGV